MNHCTHANDYTNVKTNHILNVSIDAGLEKIFMDYFHNVKSKTWTSFLFSIGMLAYSSWPFVSAHINDF